MVAHSLARYEMDGFRPKKPKTMNLQRVGWKNWALINQTNTKVNSDDKKMKIDKFMLKKIVISKVRGDLFLYISFRFDYKINSYCYNVLLLVSRSLFCEGSLLLYSSFQSILALHLLTIQASTLMFVPSDTLSDPLCIRVNNATLFRALLHINATKKLAAEHSMPWQQVSPQICLDSSLSYIPVMHTCINRTFLECFPDAKPTLLTSALTSRGGIHPRPTLPGLYDQN